LATTAIIKDDNNNITSVKSEVTSDFERETFDRKLELVTADLQSHYSKDLRGFSPQISVIIVDYLLAMKSEKNLSAHSREGVIKTLTKLSRFVDFKNWKAITRQDILAFLDSYRKTDASDPLHKWIGTYNLYIMIITPFFKWLYYPELERKARPKPACVANIPTLRRKEKSIYKPADLWTQADDLLFLKYCPSKRDRCYHAISRDLSARPDEIINLRRGDVNFKLVGNSQYAEVTVNGKTGTRPIPLISSIPYLKDWWDDHPQRGNPGAFLIPSLSHKKYCRRMTVNGLYHIYRNYRQQFFPRLLQDPDMPQEDKNRLTDLLQKPWNPYVRRHSALTEKSTILKEHILRQHAGWTGKSQMHLKYLHYFGNESSESLLEAYGIVNPDERADIFVLKPKSCPNCNTPNKPDSKFCSKCRMVLSYDAYEEMKEQQIDKDMLESLKQELEWLKGRAVMK
jgi:integrase/recombinase XerD